MGRLVFQANNEVKLASANERASRQAIAVIKKRIHWIRLEMKALLGGSG